MPRRALGAVRIIPWLYMNSCVHVLLGDHLAARWVHVWLGAGIVCSKIHPMGITNKGKRAGVVGDNCSHLDPHTGADRDDHWTGLLPLRHATGRSSTPISYLRCIHPRHLAAPGAAPLLWQARAPVQGGNPQLPLS